MIAIRKVKPHRGFTLIEILVVVSIIALLIGILVPTLSRAREQSRRAVCVANLHTLGEAMLMYADANQDLLPNGNPRPFGMADPDGSTRVLVSLYSKMARSAAVFHCPSDKDPVPTKIVTADYLLPNSGRVSYEFYSIWWMPEAGPTMSKMSRLLRLKATDTNKHSTEHYAPLAWDLEGGYPKPHPFQNHGFTGGNVVYADAHAGWQLQPQWDKANWPHPAQEIYDASNKIFKIAH